MLRATDPDRRIGPLTDPAPDGLHLPAGPAPGGPGTPARSVIGIVGE